MSSGIDVNSLGKRQMDRLAGMQNLSASSSSSAYGKKLLEKMGWSKGDGLGKDGNGIKESIIVKKKDDEQGVGFKEASMNRWNDCWWFDAYDSTAKKISSVSPIADSDSESDSDKNVSPKAYSDAELFAACKGRRLGMRARKSQKGKWERSEDKGTLPEIQNSIYSEEHHKKEHHHKKEKKEHHKKEKKEHHKKEKKEHHHKKDAK